MEINISFTVPAIITMEDLKAAEMPQATWNSMNKELRGVLDMQRIEDESPRFLFEMPNFGKKGRLALERYLYEKYKYRFPPQRR